MGARFKLLLFSILVGLGLFFFSAEAYAAVFFDQAPPPGSNQVSTDLCGGPVVCANSYNVGNCGLPDCPGGLDWTKYTLTCIESGDLNDPYASYYQETAERICSIGDKCVLGEQGLRYGQCDCGYSVQRYKVCCSSGTSAVCENSPSILQDGTYPPEGQCPSGTTETFCGFDPYPPCDSACSAPRQCNQLNRTYNQCCGTGLSQQVQEYVWDDGSGEVCNYVSGACNQSDPACGGSYNTSCTNLSVAKGSSGTSNVTLTLASGTVPPVGSFSVTNLPAGASATFSPTSCTPNCSTTMTISTISSTPAGNYTISVNGSPSAAAKNTCTLTIPPPGCTLPTVDIKANSSDGPVNIANNTSANLTWTTGNSPTSCTASGAWSGAKSVSGGSQSSGNLPGPNSYNFTITCSNTCGSNSDVVTINVPSPSTNCSFGSLSNPDGISPNPVPYNSSTSTYSNTQISWSTASYNSSNVYYYNPGSCTLSNCPSSGWTFITSAPADGTWDYVWNPNSFGPAQGSTHTIGITDSNNVLRCVKDVTFGSSTPPPASSSCTGISGPNTLLLQGGKATGTYAANFGGDSTNLVFHWSDNQGSTDDTVDNDVNWTFYNTGSYTLSATYSNATGSGSCGSKNIQVVQPSSICAEFDVTPDPTYVNTNAIIRPLVSNYSIISRIDVRYYKYPQPAAPPFTESNWQSIKTLQGTQHCVSGHVVESDGEPDEFICDVYDPNTFDWTENQKTTDWKTPNYEGYYYLGMEVYGADGTKIAGWNSGDTTDCTEVIRIRDDSTCIQNKPVYPDNLNASVINDDDVLLQWQIRNSNGSVNDSEQAYISTQAGFTPSSSNRVVSRLKAGSSLSVTDSSSTLSNLKNPVFYKVSAFNNASPGESPFSSTQGMAPLPFDTDTCSLSSSPTTATNFNISGSTFTWRKPSIAFATYSGWRVVNNNGLIFDVPASEVTESFYDSNNRQITWTMPTLIAGTYYIQAYAVLCDGKMYFGPISNTAVLSTSTSAASAPTTAPSGVTTTMGGGFKDQQPVITSWTDTNTNEAGFHLYRSTESLDPAKRTAATNYSLNNALFENLPAGTYYLAVKVTNNCGVGWSNYVKVDLTLTVKPWIQTTGGDVHSNVRINTPGGP